MNSKLKEALAIYRSLGYEEAEFNELLELGVGTKEEQKIAKDGLKSGEWMEFRQLSETGYGLVNVVDVDLEKLAIFAVRVGVDARRASNVLARSSEVALEAIKHRGKKYAADFIGFACTSRRRAWEHSDSFFGGMCVRLLHELELEIPESVEYIKDWAFFAAKTLNLKTDSMIGENKNPVPGLDMIKTRFREHIEVGIAINTPATGPFSKVLLKGVEEGFLPLDDAKSLVFLAMDMAVRPGDRKEWVKVLTKMGIDREDVVSRTENLVSLLAFGETPVIEAFAPLLIAHAKDEDLSRILMASFAAKTKKVKQLVLKEALKRQAPKEDGELYEWIVSIRDTDDKTLTNLIDRLSASWNIDVSLHKEEELGEEPVGLWQKTPPLWEVPRFELGEVSSEDMTELAATVSNRRVEVYDLVNERFLAAANKLAVSNPEEAKLCLAGVRPRGLQILRLLNEWARNKPTVNTLDPRGRDEEPGKRFYSRLFNARNYIVCSNIDKLPCILSTPSFEDLSINLSDLAERLLKYKEEGCSSVWEPDLQLALTRLDVESATKSDLNKIKKAKLYVKMPDGQLLKDDKNKLLVVCDVVLNYLKDPCVEPELDLEKIPYWNIKVELPKSLECFPNRFYYTYDDMFSAFPLWGDYAMVCVRRDTEVYHGQGLILRQVVRRRKPLGKAGTMNFFAVQSYLSDENAGDVLLATREAWERGLLLPGRAEVKYLDWRGEAPSNLASLAKALDGVAQDGILSVVWEVADDLIAASLRAPRMIAGTAELVKFLQNYLEEVFFAVRTGLAPQSVLELKGLRSLASRSGSSAAVTTAKAVVQRIENFEDACGNKTVEKEVPSKKAPASISCKKLKSSEILPKEEVGMGTQGLPFEEFWKVQTKSEPMIEDHVQIKVDVLKTERSVKLFVFTLKLPEIEEFEYKIISEGWLYGFESEGQTSALELPSGSPNDPDDWKKNARQVWLHFDEEEHKMVVSPHRNWKEEQEGALSKNVRTRLSSSLLTVIIALIAQDGDAIYSVPRLIRKLVDEGELSQDTVRYAVKLLLQHEAVSPAKLVRILEKEPQLLSVFWVMSVECIRFAGGKEKAPTWVNRVLDNCLYYAYYFKEAIKRGFISDEEVLLEGLRGIAHSKKSAAKEKAERFLAYLLK